MTNRKTMRSRAGALSRLRRQLAARPRPLWAVCVAHVLALGVALLLYALPHHVIPRSEQAIGVTSTRVSAVRAVSAEPAPAEAQDAEAGTGTEPENSSEAPGEDPVAEATAEPQTEAIPEPVVEDEEALSALFGQEAVGSFRKRFAEQFTGGDVERTDSSYRSENLCVTLSQRFVEEINARAYVADIYIADISCLTTAFSKDTYGRGYTEWIEDVATRYKSVVTLNGDYYGSRSTGVIIRNGVLYREKKSQGDIAVLYWDGHMEAIRSSKFNASNEMDKGAYQSWSFGPSLLDEDGKPLKHFNCGDYLIHKHPRSAIGYFEPGHYCFVTVDGRNDESNGAGMTELAKLMSSLGCKLAYNLDGGQTSLMCIGSKLYNHPSQGGRDSSDYIMIVDRVS